jgi:5-methylcytosine-specific restriction endonuclease McrA
MYDAGSGGPFRHHKRCNLSLLERARFFVERGGQCAQCTRFIKPAEDWEVDHVHPLAAGGDNASTNLQLLCEFCHSHKTSDDVGMIAKGKRVAMKHILPGRFKKKRAWR